MTIAELLADHPQSIRDLSVALLDHVRTAAEWSDERVYVGWHGVGFHHVARGYVVGVFPREGEVRVLFEHGHMLGDVPHLEGNGQTRWLTFIDLDDERLASFEELLQRALG